MAFELTRESHHCLVCQQKICCVADDCGSVLERLSTRRKAILVKIPLSIDE